MLHVIPFFARASPQSEKCTGPCVAFARSVREELGVGARVGVAGYCWGGYQALNLARLDGVVDAVFVAHPAKFEAKHVVDAVGGGARVSFAHAGDDMALPMERVEEVKEKLQGKEGWEVRVYEGCVHGFAVRATPGKEKEAVAADEALRQAVEWFGKSL